ncbi:MAG: hypothetical protein ACUVXD_13210, partial [Thermodesulfobacteriota bacterium]
MVSSVSSEGKDFVFLARRGGTGSGPLMLRKLMDPEDGGGSIQDVWGGELQLSLGSIVADEYGMVLDEGGGVWIAWADNRNGNNDIFLQHVLSDGTLALRSYGLPLCTALGDQWNPRLISDGEGGVIVVWQDQRTSPEQVYGQRVNANGVALWETDGLLISSIRGSIPQIVRTSDNYFLVVWRDDDASGGAGSDFLRAQKLTGEGYPVWEPDGVKVTEDPGAPSSFVALKDQSGGGVVFFSDDGNIYGNRVIFDGTMSSFVRFYGPPVVGTGNAADYVLRVGNMG